MAEHSAGVPNDATSESSQFEEDKMLDSNAQSPQNLSKQETQTQIDHQEVPQARDEEEEEEEKEKDYQAVRVANQSKFAGALARRWSTPARCRLPAAANSIEQQETDEPPASLNNIDGCSTCERNMRHSHRDQKMQQVRHHHHHHHLHREVLRHKSISSLRPASSSASDSAFSRSQTTLGSSTSSSSSSSAASDSGRSNHCNKKTLTSGDVADRLSTDGCSSGSGQSVVGSLEQDHFKIVWRQLSYRIPEKRFARALAYVGKLREKWASKWDGDDQESVPDDDDDDVEKVYARSLHNAASGGGGSDGSDGAHLGALGAHQAKQQPAAQPLAPPLPAAANFCMHNKLESGLSPMAPPSTKLKLAKLHKQRTRIFTNLNGCVRSGQLTAILGPSGAGKTTFLKCLTNSITKGVSGSITIQGGASGELTPTTAAAAASSASSTSSSSSRSSQHLKLCIIPQKDYLFDNLTVMENLLFASRIKNTQANFDHEENVYRITNLLGLLACLKLKTSRLSGGQYKRVSIAQELLSQPDILILDEPTSGLDSLTCFRTVSVLRDLADMSQAGLLPPLAIIMTIHQPQIKIFNLFHHVYVLSALGQCVFEGRPGYLLDTVEDRCKLLPPPDDQNPASFIIDIASEVYGAKPIEQLVVLQQENFELLHPAAAVAAAAAAVAVAKEVTSSQTKQQPLDLMIKVVTTNGESKSTTSTGSGGSELVISNALKKRHNHEHNFWLHTRLLIKRHWISTWRDSLLTKTRVTFHLIIPLVFWCVYSQKSGSANACPHVERELDIHDMVSDSNIERLTVQHDELILTFENVSLFFILLYSFSMCVLALTALSFPLNMQILLKETANGWYTMPRFVMAKTLADLPIELAMPMISVSIAYTLTGQPGSYLGWRMLSVTAIMTLCSLISQTQGLLYGAWFMNNVQAAVFVSQATSLPWIMLSGFTTRVSQLPRVLQWLSFGSIYRLGIESIMAVRYGYGMCPCDAELVNETVPKIVGIPDHLKSVMGYYLDTHASELTTQATTTNSTHTNLAQAVLPAAGQEDIFSKLASTLTRANTYGVNIVSCNDVRPFILTAREVDESTLPMFLSVLFAVLIGLKILLFYVVRLRTS